jgi:uncharacterized membrane protein
MLPTGDVYGIAGVAEWIRLGLEVLGTTTIALGAATATIEAAKTVRRGGHPAFAAARLDLARYLALALEFQLAADILSTAIAPDWTRIGHLAAIGAIRTALNYFLAREMVDERRQLASGTPNESAG